MPVNNILIMAAMFQQHLQVGERRKAYWCIERWETPLYHKLYQIYMFFLIFLLPMSLMTFAYASICRKLWLVRYHRASMRANKSVFRLLSMISANELPDVSYSITSRLAVILNYGGHGCILCVIFSACGIVVRKLFFLRVILPLEQRAETK